MNIWIYTAVQVSLCINISSNTQYFSDNVNAIFLCNIFALSIIIVIILGFRYHTIFVFVFTSNFIDLWTFFNVLYDWTYGQCCDLSKHDLTQEKCFWRNFLIGVYNHFMSHYLKHYSYLMLILANVPGYGRVQSKYLNRNIRL